MSKWVTDSAGAIFLLVTYEKFYLLGAEYTYPKSQAWAQVRVWAFTLRTVAEIRLSFHRRSKKEERIRRDSPAPALQRVRSGAAASLVWCIYNCV